AADMGAEVGLGAGRTTRRLLNLAGDDIEIDDEGAGPMPDILMFPAGHLAHRKGQTWMLSLQGLHAGHLIAGEGAFPPRGALGCLLIGLTDRADDRLTLWVLGRGQPVAAPMGLESGFF